MYLGPKVSMSLPFVLSYLKKLATILIATLFSLSAFPQELANLNAVPQHKQVVLNWATTEEKNLSHFVIEKSIDGVEFKEAAILFTEGNSEILKSYSYRDAIAVDAPVIYYRLRIVDLDKTETYSSVRMIRASSTVKNQLELLTFPNPVTSELRITIPESWQNKQVTYEMFDGAGRLLKQIVNKSASQTEIFSLRSLNNGSYIIKAYTVEEGLVQRIIKN